MGRASNSGRGRCQCTGVWTQWLFQAMWVKISARYHSNRQFQYLVWNVFRTRLLKCVWKILVITLLLLLELEEVKRPQSFIWKTFISSNQIELPEEATGLTQYLYICSDYQNYFPLPKPILVFGIVHSMDCIEPSTQTRAKKVKHLMLKLIILGIVIRPGSTWLKQCKI